MAFSLGTLVVNLTASTASFVDGMTKAGQHVQKTAKEMEERFAGLGDIASKALAPFGDIGEKIAASLESAGSAIGGTTKLLGGMAESMGGLVAASGLAVVGIAAVGAGFVGIAAWASKGAAELQELSEKTGVSVETLSSLAYAGKQSGVSVESLGTALERLGKSAFAAATGPAGAINAYSRLGIAVRDSSGHIRNQSELLGDIAERFSHMENGTVKTALAMQIFGRAGAEMIPLLNKGKEGIADLTHEADLFGVTISGATAKQAKQFQDGLDRIEGALSGVANAMLTELLPSMVGGLNYIIDAIKDSDGYFHLWANEAKVAFEVIIFGSKLAVSAVAGLVTAFDTLYSIVENVGHILGGVFGGAVAALDKLKNHEGIQAAAQALKDGFKIGISNFADGVESETSKSAQRLTKFLNSMWHGDIGASKPEPAKDFTPNSDHVDKGNHPDFIAERIAKLTQEAAAQASLATATDRSTSAVNANRAANEAQKVITDLQLQAEKQQSPYREKFLKELDQQSQKIRALVAATLAFKEANTISDELQKQNEKLEDSTLAFQQRTAAMLSGGDAINKALDAGKLLPYVRAVDEAGKRLQELSQTQGVTNVQLDKARQAYAEANTELDKHKQLLIENRDAEIESQIATELGFQNEQSQKIAALQKFAQAHDLTNQQQLLLDGKILDMQKQQVNEYDSLLLKTNDARNGVTAFFNELSISGKNAAKDIHDSLSATFNQLSDHITNFVVNGQLGLKQLAASIEKDFIGKAVKNSLTAGLSALGSHFGLSGLGSVSKPDGSTEQNALWVQIAGNGLLGGGAGGGAGALSEILGLPSATPAGPDTNGTSAQSFFGKLGGIVSGVMSVFGGFMASGGDVQPGKAYIVGERHMELFRPNAAGRVIPNPNAGSNGKPPLVFSPQYIINTPNPDAFRKSQSQIMAEGYAAAAMAHSRNR